jgi:tRNA A-37 threonylcarbamoyl transferase component Bud32
LVDLLYGDWRIRSARGAPIAPESLYARFPEVAESLRRQIELDNWLSEAVERDLPSDVALVDETQSATPALQPSSNDDEFSAPLPFSDFKIGRRLGAGGMGEVYEAEQKSLGRVVAVKVIRGGLVDNLQVRARFLREARIIAKLRHPHIAAVHGIGRTSDGGLFIAMELIRGRPLDERLMQGAPSIDEAVRIIKEVARALAHAHAAGIVHRDLKPGNVLIEPDGRVVVVDFGLARINSTAEPTMSSPSQVLGTPQFLAPEVIDSSLGEPGVGVDVYGLGCLFYVLLTGVPPFSARSVGELMRRAISQDPVSPTTLRAEVPPALADVCLRALRKRPVERFPGVVEFAQAVETAAEDGAATGKKVGGGRRIIAWPRAALICVCLGLFVLAGILFPRGTAPINATWNVQLFPQGDFERRVELLQSPQQVYAGDSIRIHLTLSRPGYPYLFWIDADGAWVQLYPTEGKSSVRTSRIEVPNDPTSALPVSGGPTWDACIAVVRDTPAPAEFDWKASLKPNAGLHWTATELLVDDQPLQSNGASVSADARDRLTGDSRTVDAAKTLTFGNPLNGWKQWRAAKTTVLTPGQIHYVVVRRQSIDIK